MAIEVNGKFYTWHDCEFSIIAGGQAREIVFDMTAISWGHSVTKTNVYGAGRAPLGQAAGQYVLDETTLEVYKEYWEAYKAALGDGYLNVDVALSIRYSTDTQAVQQTDIEGSFVGEAEALTRSDDAIVVPVRMMPTLIRTNGLIAYSDSF